MDRARNVLYRLRGSLWFLPGLMSVAAIGGAYALLVLGGDFSARAGADLWWLFSGDAGTARDLLSTLGTVKLARDRLRASAGPGTGTV